MRRLSGGVSVALAVMMNEARGPEVTNSHLIRTEHEEVISDVPADKVLPRLVATQHALKRHCLASTAKGNVRSNQILSMLWSRSDPIYRKCCIPTAI